MSESAKKTLLSSAFGFILFDEWPQLEDLSTPDDAMMYKALQLASHGVGRTHPNPPVGSLITKSGAVIAQAFHERAGLAHAEAKALTMAGDKAKGAELFVTLEPCTHFGRTPPCIDQVLTSGVAKVRVATLDPNPVVHGLGLQKLRDAKIDAELTQDLFIQALAQRMIAPFAATMTKQRPYVILKVASSLDGKVTQVEGQQSAITGKAAAKIVHSLRDKCDAVAVGRATAEIDDPKLTVREITRADGLQPLRVLFDSELKIKTKNKIFAKANCLVIHDANASDERKGALDQFGVRHVGVKKEGTELSLGESMGALQNLGLTSLLVEGGPALWTSFINAGFVDEIWWFTAPVILGAQGKSALGELTPQAQGWVTDAAHERYSQAVGYDQLTIIRIKKPL